MSKESGVCITGASRGIGLALVKQFLSHSDLVVVAATRHPEQMDIDPSKYGTRLKVVGCDIGSTTGREKLKEEISAIGKLSALIHNAGSLLFKPFSAIEEEELKNVYHVNVFTPFLLTQSLLPLMEKCHVVNISSIGGVQGSLKFGGLSAYSSSKAALNCLTEMWAEEMKDTDNSFNCLALGSVDTEMFEEAFPGVSAANTPEEMASYIYEFTRRAHKVMNGKIISVSRSNP